MSWEPEVHFPVQTPASAETLESLKKPNLDLQDIIVLCVHNSLVRFLRGKQGFRIMQSLTAIIINNVLKRRFIALRLSSQCVISEMSR